MPSFATRGARILIVSAVAGFGLFAAVGSVNADGVTGPPLLELLISIDGGEQQSLSPGDGTSLGGGTYNFAGSQLGGSYSLSWDLNVNADPFVNGNLAVTNLSLSDMIFDLMVVLPVTPIAGPTVIGGSAQLGFTASSGGGSVSTLAGQPGWQALIDGTAVHSFYPAGMTVASLPGLGSTSTPSQSFGTPIPSASGPSVASSIGLHLQFVLTPGDAFSITSVFVVDIPGPAGLAVLAGAVVIRRRRRE